MARKFFVGGNFKMNPSNQGALSNLLGTLNSATLDENTEVVIAPPSLYLISVQKELKVDIAVSAQNCYFECQGAFTGEISPKQLADAGIPWVILGHSERRTIFTESSEHVATKTRVALESGLKVILCIGETLEQRKAKETRQVNEAQLRAAIKELKKEDWKNIVIAYEPVWAIGTGVTATPEQAQEAHKDIRDFLSESVSEEVANQIRIIYGGSVTAKNCKELGAKPDIDGFLVGGASLKPEFVDIINTKQS